MGGQSDYGAMSWRRRVLGKVTAVAAALGIVAVVSVSAMATASADGASSGGHSVEGVWNAVYHCTKGWCAGQDFPATMIIATVDRSTGAVAGTYAGSPLTGTFRGSLLTITVNVGGGYSSTGTAVLSPDGKALTGADGTSHDSNGTSGATVATLVGAPKPLGATPLTSKATGPFTASSSRSSLLAIPNPGDALTAKNVGLAGLITIVLFVCVVFPSTLFNNTLEANIDVFRRRMPRWLRGREVTPDPPGKRSFWHTNQGYLAFVVLAALLYSRMQPGFGANRATVQTFLGFLVGAIVSTSIGIGIRRAYLARRLNSTGHLEVELGTLVFAVVCVVASRLADFVPGYFYGVVAVFVASVEPPEDDKGRMATIGAAVTLSLAVVAWFLLVPLDHLAHGGNLLAQLPRSLVGGLFSGGTEALAIGLTPIRFLPGATLKKWNAKVWGAFYAAGLFLFTLGLLHPGLASTHEASVGWTLGLALTFGVGSIAFWAYFRNRSVAPAAEPA